MPPESSSSFFSKLKKFIKANQTPVYTIVGVATGLAAGLLVKSIFWSNDPVNPYLLRYISLPGVLYIRLFLLLIVPLLISSISTSFISNDDSKTKSGSVVNAQKLLLITMGFFISFTVLSGILGISLMSILKPGGSSGPSLILASSSNNSDLIEQAKKRIEQTNYRMDSLFNLILNMFPDNIISLLFMSPYTKTETLWPGNLSTITEPNFVPKLKQQTIHAFKPNMIGICVVSFLLGLLLKSLGPEKSRNIRGFLRELDGLVGESFKILLKFMPAGMFLWMFAEGLKMSSVGQLASQLVYFYLVVISGFAILWAAFYPTVYFLFTRSNAFQFYKQLVPALLIAFGSCSSAITLPMTMECMLGKAKLPKPIAQTVLPLGMTIHMNGPAMYYPMVALFVAQIKQVEVDFFMLGVLIVFDIMMTMGFPGAPVGGGVIVNHIAYASIIGIDDPLAVLAFIVPFEPIFERIRTMTNILGDCIVAKCVETCVKTEGDDQPEVLELS